MQDLDDLTLLREYAARDSEAAFAELVARRVGFVYSAALRQVRDPLMAEEITQAVFIILAQKAGRISDKTILCGWLFKTTRYAAIAQTRERAKRSLRTATIEKEFQMQSEIQANAPDALWEKMSPLLDEALATLGETDRQAVLLRFFENKSLAEVGSHLGTGEDTARKRVARALEKLHRYFNKRGVSSTTAILAGAISANSVQAAPVTLAKAVTAVAIAKGAAASGSALILVKGALKAMTWAKMKFACGIGTVALLAGSAITIAVVNANSGQPDPVALLKKVAAAREKIKSGEMEFIVARHDYKWNIQTNYALLKIAFDGENRRFEQLQRETAYASTNEAFVDAKRLELNGDDDALAQLGLIKLQDAHYRTVYDGKTLIRFDPLQDTTIDDPARGSFTYIFDPRTFGLADNESIGSPIENFFGYEAAQSVKLIGRESVGNIVAWHIRVQVADTWRYEFWIDVNHPTHVIKQESPNVGTTILARFDEQNPNDPIPLEVDSLAHYGGDPRPWETRMVRKNARYNVPIDPKAFTLAGLGMPVGTSVNDDRIMRRIGYWTGSSLSENFPRNAPSHPRDVTSVLENNVQSLENARADSSFIDKRKIVLRRVEIGVGLFILIFIVMITIKRLVVKFH
jgi:RNA polymerase sigma factor (sigma-70 family)